jgi:hypothetical protein
MMPGISISTTADLIVFGTIGFVILVSILLVFALIRVVLNFIQQMRSSAAASLLNAFQRDIASGDFARRLQQPKSLSGMDAVYGPQVARDFPELNLDELKIRAERLVFTTLEAIGSENFDNLSERSELYNSQLTSYLAGLQSVGEHEFFAEIKIHRIVLADYRKAAGTCRLAFEMAIEADYSRLDSGGQLVTGGQGVRQFTGLIEALYIQDLKHTDRPSLNALAFNCPNCGAPVTEIGSRQCNYCSAAIEPLNNRVWTFCDFSFKI